MPVESPRHEPLAYVMRSGLVESVHHGSMVVLAADGSVRFAAGDPDAVHYPRSALKPVQAAAMARLGLELPAELLSLAASSHSGESQHVEGVRRMLALNGLAPNELANPADLPLDPKVRDEWLATGAGPNRLVQNCSGKHAAMLATARHNGWTTHDYLDPAHPLQRKIARTVAELASEPVAHVAVDGCGAPLFALSLTGLARAAGRVAHSPASSPEGRVARAIREHPEMLGGTGRPVTELIHAVPGLIAKDGIEGVFVAALPDGSAVAVKVADGSNRPRTQLAAVGLRMCGVRGVESFVDGADRDQTDGVQLAEIFRPAVRAA